MIVSPGKTIFEIIMKTTFTTIALLLLFQLTAQVFFTETRNFRGHIQGFAAGETGIYCAFGYDMVKFDFTGKILIRRAAPPHAGDITTDGEKIYCAVALWQSVPASLEVIKKYNASSCIFVYNKNLELLEIKPLKNLYGIDGIAFINGKFYIALNHLGAKRRTENKIAIFDRNFNLLKIATVTIGSATKFGAQTLNNYQGKLLAAFYGGGRKSYIFDPQELENSSSIVKPVATFPENVNVGFCETPPALAPFPGTFITARNTRNPDPKYKPLPGQGRSGVKFQVKYLDSNGILRDSPHLKNIKKQ